MAVTTPTPCGGISNDAQLVVYGPAPQIAGVVNSASFQQGTVTPGEIITVFGVGLGPAALAIFNPAAPPIPVPPEPDPGPPLAGAPAKAPLCPG